MNRGRAREAASELAKYNPKHLDSIESLRGAEALMLLYHLAELVKIPLPGSLAFKSSDFQGSAFLGTSHER